MYKWGNAYINTKVMFGQKSSFEIQRLYRALSIAIPKKSRILDIGCGKGVISNLFANDNMYEYYGLDISNVLVAYSAKNYGPHFFIGDGARLPLKDNSFDAVIFNAVLHHITTIKVFLQEAARVLRPGGIIFIQEPNRYSFQILTLGINAPLRFIYKELLDPNERPLSPGNIQKHLQGLQLDVYCRGTNVFPIKFLTIFPTSISNFINRFDMIVMYILHYPLICANNFRIIARKRNEK